MGSTDVPLQAYPKDSIPGSEEEEEALPCLTLDF